MFLLYQLFVASRTIFTLLEVSRKRIFFIFFLLFHKYKAKERQEESDLNDIKDVADEYGNF